MSESFDFNDLFVFDLANNHQGCVDHGERVIREVSSVANGHGVRGVFKFQYRQLNSFIHPDHQKNSDNKHIPRFLSTRLSQEDNQRLFDVVKECGLITACTPFDESSVDIIAEMGFDILKIASCSAQDWPLLEAAVNANLPIIISTGGLKLCHIDDVVSFFNHRGVDFAIMHCVSIYPTPDNKCQLNQVEVLRKRYPGRVIGWSTHEDQDATAPVQIAYAKGARMFERHVGIATDSIKLNAYSSTPVQVDKWLNAHKQAIELCGQNDKRPKSPKVERQAILGLRRGVYALEPIKKGQVIERDQVFFAMPCVDGQFHSGQWKTGIIAEKDFNVNEGILEKNVQFPPTSDYQIIKSALHDIKALLNEARIPLNSDFKVEYSHHYGMARFREVGAVLIDCVNRSYCKKIVVQLPGQKHPAHFHKRKEETFQILYGDMHVKMDGHERFMRAGETCLIQPGVWHSFWTDSGCIFEEVSTTDFKNDSFYKDKVINDKKRDNRKTVVDHWGRFQNIPEDVLKDLHM